MSNKWSSVRQIAEAASYLCSGHYLIILTKGKNINCYFDEDIRGQVKMEAHGSIYLFQNILIYQSFRGRIFFFKIEDLSFLKSNIDGLEAFISPLVEKKIIFFSFENVPVIAIYVEV